MDTRFVLVAAEAARVRRVAVPPGGIRVPWVAGLRADPARAGVVLAGPGAGEASGPLPAGRATTVGGLRIACLQAAPPPDDAIAVRLGPSLAAASDAMVRVLADAASLATLGDPVLLLGESGTGKDLLARAIHALGPGEPAPWVAVNLAALPYDLVESELFGWVRGAFTGAVESRPGAFETAAGGTLFLDELAEAPPGVQAKLLRAVEGGVVTRVGSSRPVEVACRLIAAMNREPGIAVGSGRLRLDLLQRLACLVVRIPPLRDRPRDVPVLARLLCADLPGRPSMDDGAEAALADYAWPGNVRELRNVVRRAWAWTRQSRLGAGAVRDSIAAGRLGPGLAGGLAESGEPAWGRPTRTQEIEASGMPRSTYYHRLKRGRIVPGAP
jgi:two-component system response regulator HydG